MERLVLVLDYRHFLALGARLIRVSVMASLQAAERDQPVETESLVVAAIQRDGVVNRHSYLFFVFCVAHVVEIQARRGDQAHHVGQSHLIARQ